MNLFVEGSRVCDAPSPQNFVKKEGAAGHRRRAALLLARSDFPEKCMGSTEVKKFNGRATYAANTLHTLMLIAVSHVQSHVHVICFK